MVPATDADGLVGYNQLLLLINRGSYNIYLRHESTSSDAANRFRCPGGQSYVLRHRTRPSGSFHEWLESRWFVTGPGTSEFGSAFPTSPSHVSTRTFRTDIELWFVYTPSRSGGRRPCSRCPCSDLTSPRCRQRPLAYSRVSVPSTANGSDIYVVSFNVNAHIASGGSALSGSHNWTGTLNKYNSAASATTLGTVEHQLGQQQRLPPLHPSVESALTVADYFLLSTTWTRVGTPGKCCAVRDDHLPDCRHIDPYY